MFLPAVLFLTILFPSKAMEVEVLHDAPGIFFNNVGNANIYQSTWKLIIHYDLRTFIAEFQELNVCVNKITNLCAQLRQAKLNNSECLVIERQLLTQLREIQNSQEFISPSLHPIHRRSLFDAGGYALNYAVGTLDHRYQVANDDNVKNLKTRQDYLSTLIQNHTSLLDNTASLFQKTDRDIRSQFELFNRHLAKIDFDGNHDKLAANLFQHLNYVSTYTALIFTRFRNTQLYILDTLSSAHSSGLQLLSPALLHRELLNIERTLPNDLHLPKSHNQLDVELIFKISSKESFIQGTSLDCVLHIPLLISTNYQLFLTIPIPTKSPHGYSYIEPQKDVLLVSLNRDQSTFLSKQDFKSCFLNHDKKYFCESHNPIYIATSNNFDCELQLLKFPKTFPKTCNIRQAMPGDYWIQIDANRYIFVLHEPLTVDLICYQNVTHYPLRHTGILHIPPRCQLRSKDLIIYAGNSDPTRIYTGYMPALNMSDIAFTTEYRELPQRTTPFLLQLNDSSAIAELSARLQTLKIFHKNEPNFNLHFVKNSHYYTLFILAALLLGTIFFIAHKIRLLKRCSSYIFKKPSSTEVEFTPFPSPTVSKETTQSPVINDIYHTPSFRLQTPVVPNRTEIQTIVPKRRENQK